MPGMAGSLGRFSGPVVSTANRAAMWSPLSVRAIQRAAPSFQSIAVTWVEKAVRSCSPYCSAMRRQWARISGALE